MTTLPERVAEPVRGSDRSQVLRRALVELRAARAEAAEARRQAREPIAVIGMGCRFPGGASGVDAFWDLLAAGRSGVTEVPADRWDVNDFYDADPDAPGRTYARHGGFLDGIREFDAGLFGVPPREVVHVDPQQRLILEVAWEALEHAGIAPDSLRGSRTGVFVGMGGSDYERLNLSTGDVSTVDGYSATGTAGNMAANRLSYVLGLEGPSMVVDTACSSSLVAVHLAVQALRAGDCDLALVAGVNTLLSPGTTVALSKGRMLSPEGRCKTFDASADGYVRGEGCGVVVLRRLSAARAERDRIWAVVKGSAVNQDGPSSGLTVPRASAQRQVVRRALDAAGVAPADVGYVEAHGTGTSLGDPIEVRALAAVLGEGRDPSRPVALGSVKTNIGHLEAAAGIAGLIKTVLVLDRKAVPPHLNLVRPNPAVAWDELPVTVPTELTPWPEERRVAGVSSFGFGGTNAHVVLESAEPDDAPADEDAASGPALVKVSGRGETALREAAARLASWTADTDEEPHRIAWEAAIGRADLSDRAAVVAESRQELLEGLRAVAEGRQAPNTASGRRSAGGAPRIGFAVPERSPRLAGALAGLYGRMAAVTETVDEVAEVVGPLDRPPLSVLLDDSAEAERALRDDAVAATALFTAAVALGRLWRSAGVEPQAVAGRGRAGALAAQVLSGARSVADAARLVPEDPAAAAPPAPDGLVGDIDLVPAENADPAAALSDRGAEVVVDLDAGTRRGFLEELARVWAAGADVDWAKVVGPRPRRTPVLPTYPFQRRAYWPENADPRRSLSRRAVEDADGVGTGLRPRILRAATGETIGEAEVSLSRVPFLDEHRVHGRLVVPGVLFLELVLRCAEEAFGAPARAQDLVVSRSLVLGDDDSATVQAVVDRPASGRARARVFSRDASGRWQQHFETVVQPADADDATEPPPGAVPDAALDAGRDRCAESIDTPDLYGQVWHPMFRIGPSFRLLRGVRRGPGAAVGVLVPPAADAAGVAAGVRPELLLLDACIQLVAVAALSPDGFDGRPVHLGTGYERIWIGDLDGHERLECVAVLRDAPDGPVIGDLRLVGADGETAARIWGASFRPVSRDMLDRLLADHARASGAAGSAAPDAGGVADLLALGEADRERAVLDRLTGMLAAILGCAVDEVEPDAVLVDVADSLMIAEMRTRIEQDLCVPVTMEDLFDGVSLRTLAPVVTGLLPAPGPAADPPSERAREFEPAPDPERAPEPATTAEPAAPEPAPARPKPRVRGKTVEEMTVLAELDPSIAAVGAPEPPGTAPKATLLTGGTGFVGAFLLDELLKRRDGEVYCLVRADDAAHAARRLESNLRRYGLETGARMSRVVPVVGDLAEPLLGLDDARFAELHGEIGDIVHCGGMVKWTYPYSGLAGANVDGTREVLRLATLGAPRPVHFISTVGVFSSKEYTADTVSEDVPLTSSGSLVVGYAQTKWVAERMVRTAAERGLPVTIHRINTGGHSVTGAFNRLDHLSLILKGCVEAGIAPHTLALMPVQPAPIDYVAAAVVALADRPEALGGTFHLVNERAMTWRELFDAVEEFGYPLRRLPLDDWREQVTGRNAGTMALLGLAPFLRDTMDHARLPFSESSITKAALEGAGVCCPPLTTELVHTFLRGFVEAGFVPPPRTASARPAPSSSASVSSAS